MADNSSLLPFMEQLARYLLPILGYRLGDMVVRTGEYAPLMVIILTQKGVHQ